MKEIEDFVDDTAKVVYVEEVNKKQLLSSFMNTTNNEEWEEKIINLASNMFDVDFSIDDLGKKAFFDHIRSERSSVRRETVEACKEVLKDYFSGLAIMAFPEHSLKSILTNLDTISHEEN